MLDREEAAHLFKNSTLILDGGLATELENHGHDLSNPLWSGKMLLEDPDAIRQVHLDYYLAGADIAITASYQGSEQGLMKHLHIEKKAAGRLIERSVRLAQEARDLAYTSGVSRERRLLVAGSCGPYGAFLANGSEYTGLYSCNGDTHILRDQLCAFHAPQVRHHIDAGADLLVFETIPNIHEIAAIMELLKRPFSSEVPVAILSCTLKDSTHISDGTPVRDVVELIDSPDSPIVAFGVNCVPPDLVPGFLKEARAVTSMPLLCYPNSGEVYNAETKSWSGSASVDVAGEQWLSEGASIIGGCCRTTPAHIRELASMVQARRH